MGVCKKNMVKYRRLELAKYIGKHDTVSQEYSKHFDELTLSLAEKHENITQSLHMGDSKLICG